MATCRYCGKPLPLLERISGPGTFCSREHKERFQEEYSRLALRRLLGETEDEPDRVQEAAPSAAEPKTAVVAVPASRAVAATPAAAAVARADSDGRTAAPPGKTPIPRLAGAVPATPDLVPVRRGGKPRLPAPGWTWRPDWESLLLAEPRIEEPAGPEPRVPAQTSPVQRPAPVAALTPPPPSAKAALEPAAPPALEEEPAVVPAFRRVRVEGPKAVIAPAPVVTPAAGTLVPGPPVSAAPVKLPKAAASPAVETPPPAPKLESAPPEAPAAPVEAAETAPEPRPEESAAPAAESPAGFSIPGFEIEENRSLLARIPMVARVAAVLAAVVLTGFGIHRVTSSKTAARPAAAKTETARAIVMGPGGWFTHDMPDRTRERIRAGAFSIYRPSLELSDYRVEFTGRIESVALGWVVRWSDPDNYQAVKLIRQAGRYRLTRYVMLKGEESARQETPLTGVGGGAKGYNIRMDVRGPRYTVFLAGQQVDSWTDHRLARGGFGFLNEGDERGRVDSIQVFVLNR